MRVTEKWREDIKSGKLPENVRKVVIPEIKAIDEDARKASFVISNGNEDRDGDVIEVAGWELGAFKENPVVLWAHDASELPIAKAETIGVEGDNLVASVVFPEKGIHSFADKVFEFVKGGFLRGASVGFQPLEAEPREGGQGIHFKRQELFEFSILPIPAHREALAQAKAAGLDVEPMLEWAEKLLSNAQESGLWIPRFSIEKAISLVVPGLAVKAAPGVPSSEGNSKAGGHAAPGAGSDPKKGVMKGAHEDDEDDKPKPRTVSQIIEEERREDEIRDRRWELEFALQRSIESISSSDLTDEEKREMLRQTTNEFVAAVAALEVAAAHDDDDEPDDMGPQTADELAAALFPEDDEDGKGGKAEHLDDCPDPDNPDCPPEETGKGEHLGEAVDEALVVMIASLDEILATEDPEAKAEALKASLEAFAEVVMAAPKPEEQPAPDDLIGDLEAEEKADEDVLAELEGMDPAALRDIVVNATNDAADAHSRKNAGRLPD